MSKEKGDEPKKESTLVTEGERARLVLETGEDQGKEFLVNKSSVTVGRHVDNDVCIPGDRMISRFHGRIFIDKETGAYFFEDLGSTNGTTVGDKWFKNEKVEIKHGDTITLGGKGHTTTRLRFYTKRLGLKDWILG